VGEPAGHRKAIKAFVKENDPSARFGHILNELNVVAGDWGLDSLLQKCHEPLPMEFFPLAEEVVAESRTQPLRPKFNTLYGPNIAGMFGFLALIFPFQVAGKSSAKSAPSVENACLRFRNDGNTC
jgi:hypothetical protein